MTPLPRSTPKAALDEIERLKVRLAAVTAERDALLGGALLPLGHKPGRLVFPKFNLDGEGVVTGDRLLPMRELSRVGFVETPEDGRLAIEITDGTHETYPRRPALLIRGVGARSGCLAAYPRSSNVLLVSLADV